MKNRTTICVIIFIFPFILTGEFKTGFYLSMGQMHYSLKSFSENDNNNNSIESKDLLLGASIQLKNKVEINLIYNRVNGEVTINNSQIAFDKDGFGIEIGKLISIDLFKKNSFLVSMEFISGAYFIFYPFKKIQHNLLTPTRDIKESNIHYQGGLYFTIRLKNIFLKKATFDLGFKSLLPIRSNEFISSDGHEYLLFKSFIFVGISF